MVRLTDSLPDDAVVCAEDQKRPPFQMHFFPAGQRRDPDDILFQHSETSQGLGKAVPAALRRLSRLRIRWPDLRNQFLQRHFFPSRTFAAASASRFAMGIFPPQCRWGKAA